MDYLFGKNLPEAKNGQVFKNCNFSQLHPKTKIFEGVTGLKFIMCNLVNCELPEDSVIEDCNITQIERCTNKHPEFIELGLEKCPEECKHWDGEKYNDNFLN